MIQLIKLIVCFFRGHEWIYKSVPYITGRIGYAECSRCGKTKKE